MSRYFLEIFFSLHLFRKLQHLRALRCLKLVFGNFLVTTPMHEVAWRCWWLACLPCFFLINIFLHYKDSLLLILLPRPPFPFTPFVLRFLRINQSGSQTLRLLLRVPIRTSCLPRWDQQYSLRVAPVISSRSFYLITSVMSFSNLCPRHFCNCPFFFLCALSA